jgi:hypothetical protein
MTRKPEPGLVKLIDIQSFYPEDEVGVHVIDLAHTDSLVKSAADSSIETFVREQLIPQEGKMYLHINAMGAGEYYGSNKNGDYFPEENLKRYYKTFEISGYIYRHHINKDPAKSIGKVIFAIYNDRMHRVELIAEVDKMLGQDIQNKITAGEYPFTSMACKTPYDRCSICGNKAHTRSEYCVHLKDSLNRVLPDGRRVMAMNVGPLRFFDLSIVIRPADVTSSVLQKVAGHEESIGSASAAEIEGLTYEQSLSITKTAAEVKAAAFKKLSTMIKEVDGMNVMDAAPEIEDILSRVQNPSLQLIQTLGKFPISETINAFAEVGAAPPIKFMAELIAFTHIGAASEGLGEKAELVLYSSDPSEIPAEALEMLGEIEVKAANPILVNLIAKNSDGSLTPAGVEKRANYPYDGYLGYKTRGENLPKFVMMSPEQVKSERDRISAEMAVAAAGRTGGAFKTLLALGGAALIARYYVSSLIDSKIEDARINGLNSQIVPPYAKIVLEKQAHEASRIIDKGETHFFLKAKSSGLF